MRHRIGLLAKIQQDETQLEIMGQDATVPFEELGEVRMRLETNRAELRSYSAVNAEEMASEEVAMIEAVGDIAKENKQLHEQLQSMEAERDHFRNQTQERDDWVKENGTPEQRAEYDWHFSQQDRAQGY